MKARESVNGLIGETLFVRQFGPHPAGEKGPPHLHHIEHASFIAQGRVKLSIWPEIRRDDMKETPPEEVIEIEAPNFIVVPRDKRHQLEALEDGTTWYCIFSQDEAIAELDRTKSERLSKRKLAVFGGRKAGE